MVARLRPEQTLPRNEMYFHVVAEPGPVPQELVVKGLDEGIPLFTLRGRATLSRGELGWGETYAGAGRHLVFRIPEDERELLVAPMRSSEFEPDDEKCFLNWYTFVLACSSLFEEPAKRWIAQQKKSNFYWREFGDVTVNDVRMLPAAYFLGLY
jgi:hypothetical protein